MGFYRENAPFGVRFRYTPSMETLTLELLDVTVSQAVMELQAALSQHPLDPIQILLGPDEMIRHNLLRILERSGRRVESRRHGSLWQLDVASTEARIPHPPPVAIPLPVPPPLAIPVAPAHKPILLLRSAFTPGDPALGRRLLLGVLQTLSGEIPWIGLAHQGIDLLEDPTAVQVLRGCQDRGIPVRLSSESLLFLGGDSGPFEVMEDQEWQRLLGRGGINLV